VALTLRLLKNLDVLGFEKIESASQGPRSGIARSAEEQSEEGAK